MASRQYRALQSEVKRLRRELLPQAFDRLGQYPPRVQTRTRAYIILAHAAVEGHIENEAKAIARKAEDLWNAHKRVTAPFAYLVRVFGEPIKTPQPTGTKTPEALLAASATKAFLRFYECISNNHGLKEKNMMKLFGQLGVPSAAFGSILLQELESFGETRGSHAHQGASVVTHLDPQTEHARVERLLVELASFDEELAKFRKSVFGNA